MQIQSCDYSCMTNMVTRSWRGIPWYGLIFSAQFPVWETRSARMIYIVCFFLHIAGWLVCLWGHPTSIISVPFQKFHHVRRLCGHVSHVRDFCSFFAWVEGWETRTRTSLVIFKETASTSAYLFDCKTSASTNVYNFWWEISINFEPLTAENILLIHW